MFGKHKAEQAALQPTEPLGVNRHQLIERPRDGRPQARRSVGALGGAEGAIDRELPWRRGQQVLSAQDVSDPRLDVVHRIGELVGGDAVGAQQNQMAAPFGLDRPVTALLIVDPKLVPSDLKQQNYPAGDLFVSLKKDDDPYTVELPRVIELIEAKQAALEAATIRLFEGTGIRVVKGRFGPYITDGKKNARIDKKQDPAKLTEAEAKKILAEAPAKKGRFRKRPAKA